MKSGFRLMLEGAGMTVCGIFLIFSAAIWTDMPPSQQIGSAIFVAGGLIAAAIWFKPQPVLKVYGNDWRVMDRTEDKPHDC